MKLRSKGNEGRKYPRRILKRERQTGCGVCGETHSVRAPAAETGGHKKGGRVEGIRADGRLGETQVRQGGGR